MRVHQARQERGVTEVDRLRSRGHRSADLDDPFAVDDHQARLLQGALARIEQARGADGGGLGEQEEGEQDHGSLSGPPLLSHGGARQLAGRISATRSG